MNVIYKYNFGPLSTGIKTVTIQNEINYILDFQEQDGNMVMWASVGESTVPRQITIDSVWTGYVHPDWTYVGTIQGSDWLVYHIFMKPYIDKVE